MNNTRAITLSTQPARLRIFLLALSAATLLLLITPTPTHAATPSACSDGQVAYLDPTDGLTCKSPASIAQEEGAVASCAPGQYLIGTASGSAICRSFPSSTQVRTNSLGNCPDGQYLFGFGNAGNKICRASSGKRAGRAVIIRVNGVCNNGRRNGCTNGTANDRAVPDTSRHYKWRCDGSGGGRNSRTCQRAKTVSPSGSNPSDTSVSCTRVDGSWSALPSASSLSCGSIRVASCTNPRPSCGGRSCSGRAPAVIGTQCLRGYSCQNRRCVEVENTISCGASWSRWSGWSPSTSTVCSGESVSQTRNRTRSCVLGCNDGDCDRTNTQYRTRSGTKTTGSCRSGNSISCGASWSPSASTKCSGVSFTQTRNCRSTCNTGDCAERRSATGTKTTGSCRSTTSSDTISCGAPWSPSLSTKCSGASFTQTRNCRSGCNTGDCAERRTATGTKTTGSCRSGISISCGADWSEWSDWSPSRDSVCRRDLFRQTRNRTRNCASGCNTGNCDESESETMLNNGRNTTGNCISTISCGADWSPHHSTKCKRGPAFIQTRTCRRDCNNGSCSERRLSAGSKITGSCRSISNSISISCGPFVEWLPSVDAVCDGVSFTQTRTCEDDCNDGDCAERRRATGTKTTDSCRSGNLISCGEDWDEWSEWSPAADTVCAGDQLGQSRNRTRDCRPGCNTGDCRETQYQSQLYTSRTGTKTTGSCATSCGADWSRWSEWSPATSTACDGESVTQTRRRTRDCQSACNDGDCNKVHNQHRTRTGTKTTGSCGIGPTISCGEDWGRWSGWSPSTSTVCRGESVSQSRSRTRDCASGCNDGDCDESDRETRTRTGTKTTGSCGIGPTISCGEDWGRWSGWSPSTSTVCRGESVSQSRSRTRDCASGCNDGDCDESDRETRTRTGTKTTGSCGIGPTISCGEDWGRWSGWSPAANTVCEGESVHQTRDRTRDCAPGCNDGDCDEFVQGSQLLYEGGTKTTGSCRQTISCGASWSDWSPSPSTKCSRNLFTQNRSRNCVSGCNDGDCEERETRRVRGTKTIGRCVISCDADWNDWSEWSPAANTVCSGEPVTQERNRVRHCQSGCNDGDCNGSLTQYQRTTGTKTTGDCDTGPTISCGASWGPWNSWWRSPGSICKGTRFEQRRTRQRSCVSGCNDGDCNRFDRETQPATGTKTTGNCAISCDADWSDWSEWSPATDTVCSEISVTQKRRRTRNCASDCNDGDCNSVIEQLRTRRGTKTGCVISCGVDWSEWGIWYPPANIVCEGESVEQRGTRYRLCASGCNDGDCERNQTRTRTTTGTKTTGRCAAISCDADWNRWSDWSPATDTVCRGESVTQRRRRTRNCASGCNTGNCDESDRETRTRSGTKTDGSCATAFSDS